MTFLSPAKGNFYGDLFPRRFVGSAEDKQQDLQCYTEKGVIKVAGALLVSADQSSVSSAG